MESGVWCPAWKGIRQFLMHWVAYWVPNKDPVRQKNMTTKVTNTRSYIVCCSLYGVSILSILSFALGDLQKHKHFAKISSNSSTLYPPLFKTLLFQIKADLTQSRFGQVCSSRWNTPNGCQYQVKTRLWKKKNFQGKIDTHCAHLIQCNKDLESLFLAFPWWRSRG